MIAKKSKTREELYLRIFNAKTFIDENLDKKLAVAKIASKVFISEFHFARNFKYFIGKTPHQYIIEKRLHYALQNLNLNNNKVSEVASLAGYPCINSFSRSFKKKFKETPSSYKSKNIN